MEPRSSKVNRQKSVLPALCIPPECPNPTSAGGGAGQGRRFRDEGQGEACLILSNSVPKMIPSIIDIFMVSLSSPSPSLQMLPHKKPKPWPTAKNAFSKTPGVIWEASATLFCPKT